VSGAIRAHSPRHTNRMDICIAGPEDLAHLARLLWLHAASDEQAKQSLEPFAADLAAWWTDHNDSHLAFVARLAESEIVGMAWLALVPRVPRPGATTRHSADIQASSSFRSIAGSASARRSYRPHRSTPCALGRVG
jgi:hypothetical protein